MHKPMSAKCQWRTSTDLFNHVVGDGEKIRRNCKTERLRGLQVNNEIEFHGLQDRQVTGLGTFENLAGIKRHLAIRIHDIDAVSNSAHLRQRIREKNKSQELSTGQPTAQADLLSVEIRRTGDSQCVDVLRTKCCKCCVDLLFVRCPQHPNAGAHGAGGSLGATDLLRRWGIGRVDQIADGAGTGDKSCSRLSRFGSKVVARISIPVAFAPGRLMLLAKPSLTASPLIANTMGIVEVADLAANTAGTPPPATRTETGMRTNSFASAGN